jgi:hypothetical protein
MTRLRCLSWLVLRCALLGIGAAQGGYRVGVLVVVQLGKDR